MLVAQIARPAQSSDLNRQALNHYLGATLDDLDLATAALRDGSQLPSWIGTRLLDAGHQLGDGNPLFRTLNPTAASVSDALAQARMGALDAGRTLFLGPAPDTTALLQMIDGWRSTVQGALAQR